MYYNNIDVVEQTCKQLEKKNYIADMLVHTLYSNNVIVSSNYSRRKFWVNKYYHL